jgi:hypothetical protein
MSEGSVGKGLAIGVVLTPAGAVAAWFRIRHGGEFILIGIGLVQLLWLLPTITYYYARGEAETIKGLVIVGGLVFLLNAAC